MKTLEDQVRSVIESNPTQLMTKHKPYASLRSQRWMHYMERYKEALEATGGTV